MTAGRVRQTGCDPGTERRFRPQTPDGLEVTGRAGWKWRMAPAGVYGKAAPPYTPAGTGRQPSGMEPPSAPR